MSDGFEQIAGATPFDVSGLKDKTIRDRPALNIAEAANILKAMETYRSKRRLGAADAFSMGWAYELHSAMFCDVWDWAGQQRTVELTLGVQPHLIGMQMGGFLLDVHNWAPTPEDVLEQSVQMHFHCVRIHPFRDGNGRWSRLMANLWLRKNNAPEILWPPLSEDGDSLRNEYIAAIKAADTYDFAPLTELHRRFQGRM
jgi:Fic-DOC domain mobile mystery protein B